MAMSTAPPLPPLRGAEPHSHTHHHISAEDRVAADLRTTLSQLETQQRSFLQRLREYHDDMTRTDAELLAELLTILKGTFPK